MASRAARVEAAVSDMRSQIEELQELHGEFEQWRDGMTGTNLESTSTYEMLDNVVDTLESAISEIESALDDLEGLECPQPFTSN